MAAAFVQKTAKFTASAANSVTSAALTTTVGNRLVVTVSTWHVFGCTHTVSDNKGNSWANDVTGSTSAGPGRATIASCNLVTAGSGHTITVTSSQSDSGTYFEGNCSEFSGIASSSAVDKTATDPGAASDTSATPTTATTTQADELVVCALHINGNSTNCHITDPPSGYTTIGVQQDNTTTCGYQSGYKVVSATGAQSASWTFDSSNSGDNGMIATYFASAPSVPSLPIDNPLRPVSLAQPDAEDDFFTELKGSGWW